MRDKANKYTNIINANKMHSYNVITLKNQLKPFSQKISKPFERIFKNHVRFEGTDFTGVVGMLIPSRHVNVLSNPIFCFRRLVNYLL